MIIRKTSKTALLAAQNAADQRRAVAHDHADRTGRQAGGSAH
jgi:hypothetical protein